MQETGNIPVKQNKKGLRNAAALTLQKF